MGKLSSFCIVQLYSDLIRWLLGLQTHDKQKVDGTVGILDRHIHLET